MLSNDVQEQYEIHQQIRAEVEELRRRVADLEREAEVFWGFAPKSEREPAATEIKRWFCERCQAIHSIALPISGCEPVATERSPSAEYHRGAKEAFQRVADEWPCSREKAQTWANNCAVQEQQHRRE